MTLPRPLPTQTVNTYDGLAIFLHWAVALLVIINFLMAEFWDDFGRPAHHLMITLHISFGILLTVAVLAAIAHRARRPPPNTVPEGRIALAAAVMHHLLYILLGLQMLLGFATRWTDNKPLIFFGLNITWPLEHFSRATGHYVDQFHDLMAWTIIGLAAFHAAAALVHHFIWRDATLRNMLPGRKAVAFLKKSSAKNFF